MIVFRNIDDIRDIEPCALALGTFDGVHLGHQKLIGAAVERAGELGIKAGVFTFSNHPRDLLPNAKPVKNILYSHEKEEILAGIGVDYLFDVPFTKEIMGMDPESYVSELLVGKCNAKVLACGTDHRFGYMAQGNPDLLRKLGEKLGFEALIIEKLEIEGNEVSSSLIRTLIASGRVDRCKTYMGRNYEIAGDVVVGNRLGRKLGFPTSNLLIDPEMVTPPNGVYATICNWNGKAYKSVTNVGVKPTVGDNVKNVETHIFDFDKELYGKRIVVEFLMKMRDEVKFDSVEELSEQIVRDCREARAFHEKNAE